MENPGLDANAQSGQCANELLVQRFALFGRRGLNETGTAAAARITVQSELRYRKDRATHIEKRAIHLSLLIVKDAQVGDFFGHDRGGLRRVCASHGDEYGEARADFTGHASFYHNARATDPLDYRSHDNVLFKSDPVNYGTGPLYNSSQSGAPLTYDAFTSGWNCVRNDEANERRKNLKLALIGTHGVGKTTLAYEVCSRMKKAGENVELVAEVARRSPFPVNAATTLEGQLWILHAQIAAELDASRSAANVVCDRSVLDNYCYLVNKFGRQEQLEGWLAWWMQTYDLLASVPPLAEEIQPDGFRSEDRAFQGRIHELLKELLDDSAFAGIRKRVVCLDERDRSAWGERIFGAAIPLTPGASGSQKAAR